MDMLYVRKSRNGETHFYDIQNGKSRNIESIPIVLLTIGRLHYTGELYSICAHLLHNNINMHTFYTELLKVSTQHNTTHSFESPLNSWRASIQSDYLSFQLQSTNLRLNLA